MSSQQSSDSDNHFQMAPWRERLHEIIFEADTTAGKVFDVALIGAIGLSVVSVMLESVESISIRKIGGSSVTWGGVLLAVEWLLTLLFTAEYVLRLLCVRTPGRYATSFFGVVDVLAILPTYLSLFVAGSQSLLVIRTLRLLRVFRVFKLARYLQEGHALLGALRATRAKTTVFLVVVMTAVLILGSAMYLIEGRTNPTFDSIPRGVYWAIVTMTTVGYGDIHPMTVPGQALAAVAMIVGYSIIIVPTGIFSVEIAAARNKLVSTQTCRNCSREGHDEDAAFCKHCGAQL